MGAPGSAAGAGAARGTGSFSAAFLGKVRQGREGCGGISAKHSHRSRRKQRAVLLCGTRVKEQCPSLGPAPCWRQSGNAGSLQTLVCPVQRENLGCSKERLIGDDPEEKRCPAFAQEDRAAEAKKVWSVFPSIPGGTWLSLLGCPCALHPLQGRCNPHLVDLMPLWIRLGCSWVLGFLGQEGVRTLFFPFP